MDDLDDVNPDGLRRAERSTAVDLLSRAPYILPIAPAVAILASCVLDRWMSKGQLGRASRITAGAALLILATALAGAGLAVLVSQARVPTELTSVARVLGALLALSGSAIGYGLLLAQRRPAVAPLALLTSFWALYLVAAVWALPAVDPLKSARGFAAQMNQTLAESGGTLASFRFWDWRSGYSYYADRSIHNLTNPAELDAYWQQHAAVHVLVEARDEQELRFLLPEAEIVQQGKIGSRTAFLFAKNESDGAALGSGELLLLLDPVAQLGTSSVR